MHNPIDDARLDQTSARHPYAKTHMIVGMGIRGDRVSQLRKAKGLSQQQLAQQAGVAQSTYSRIERGESVQSYSKTLRSIALALDTTEEYLAGESDDPGPSHVQESATAELRVERDGDAKPTQSARPEWVELEEEVLAAHPEIPRDVLTEIRASGSMQRLNLPLTVASVEALARVVLRHRIRRGR
ncbi:MAG: helix-turn-helix transcriptional regulator [Myxococcales bacterium]|nr:helix-turn-helix transcriptional regulator [Myxococcales bacterium]